MNVFKFGPFELGSNTMWIGSHGLVMQLVLIALAFLFGAIWFAKQADDRLLGGLKAASLVTFLGLVLLMITGIVPDIGFEKGASFSGTVHNDFGLFQSSVTDENLAAFTGPLLFDVMEHISLIVPGLAALVCFLIWHYGKRVVEDRAIRASVLSLMTLTVAWIMVIGHLGFYVSKVLTYPYTQ